MVDVDNVLSQGWDGGAGIEQEKTFQLNVKKFTFINIKICMGMSNGEKSTAQLYNMYTTR